MLFAAIVCGAVAIAILIVLGIMSAINWALDYESYEAPSDIVGDAATLGHPDVPNEKRPRYEAEPMGA